jgi:hypothetical protein
MRIAHLGSDLFKSSGRGCWRGVVKLSTRCRSYGTRAVQAEWLLHRHAEMKQEEVTWFMILWPLEAFFDDKQQMGYIAR